MLAAVFLFCIAVNCDESGLWNEFGHPFFIHEAAIFYQNINQHLIEWWACP